MRPDFDAEKSPLITNAGENLVIYHAGYSDTTTPKRITPKAIAPASNQFSSIATEVEIYSLSGVSAKSTTITTAPNNETRIKPIVSNKKLRRSFAVGAPKIL